MDGRLLSYDLISNLTFKKLYLDSRLRIDGKPKRTESCRDDEIIKTKIIRLKIGGNHLFK